MAIRLPLLTGSVNTVEDLQPHYVLLFPNPFDPKNSEMLQQKKTVHKSCKDLARIFKLKLNELSDPDNSHIRELFKTVSWFSAGHSDAETITKGEFINGSLSVILNFIQNHAGLQYNLTQTRDRDELICRIYSKERWLKDRAEEDEYKLQFATKPDHLKHAANYPFKSVPPYAPFETTRKGAVYNSEALYKHYDENDHDRNLDKLTHNDVDSSSPSNYQSLFTYNDKVRLVFSLLSHKLDFNCMQEKGILIQNFCVHNEHNLSSLRKNWANLKALFKPQDLNGIRQYFGEKVAFYFSWMSTYMHAMSIAGIVGVVAYSAIHFIPVDPTEEGYTIPQILTVVFALFMAMWGSGFDQVWTRREKELAWRWGTINYYEEEGQRGAFKGQFGRDEVSGRNKKIRTDSTLYKLKKTTSYSVAVVFVGIVMVAVGSIFMYRASLRAQNNKYGNQICAFINAIQIRVMNIIYGKIAAWMNDWENHETETQYNDNLAVKLFLFKFVNSYISLFYIAFVQPYVEGCHEKSCMSILTMQLFTIFAINLCLNFVELGIP